MMSREWFLRAVKAEENSEVGCGARLPLDIWDWNGYKVIPTNIQVKNANDPKRVVAVMGAGLALQAKQKCPGISSRYGVYLDTTANRQIPFVDYVSKCILMPTKVHWKDDASILMILRGISWIKNNCEWLAAPIPIFVPRVGCGLGRLSWDEVRPRILEEIATKEDMFWVVA